MSGLGTAPLGRFPLGDGLDDLPLRDIELKLATALLEPLAASLTAPTWHRPLQEHRSTVVASNRILVADILQVQRPVAAALRQLTVTAEQRDRSDVDLRHTDRHMTVEPDPRPVSATAAPMAVTLSTALSTVEATFDATPS